MLYRKQHPQPVSKVSLAGCVLLWLLAGLLLVAIEWNIVSGWNWLTFIEYMGSVMHVLSLFCARALVTDLVALLAAT